jgi:beta-glucosidase/6-phospho-beta-glucosidase/beta-galactosidase
VFTTIGWLQGCFPPGRQSSVIFSQIRDCLQVLQNLLLAHVRVYKQLKAIDPNPQIGIVHNIFHIRPYRLWNPIEYIVAYVSVFV